MESAEKTWLDEYAVTCGVFRGRWSIRHCLRMYNDMNELKIHISSRAGGRVTRHHSGYNPCRHCPVLTRFLEHETGDLVGHETRGEFIREGVCA